MALFLMRDRLTIYFVTALLLFSPFHTLTTHAEVSSAGNQAISSSVNSEDADGVEGFASYYAKRYNNRRTNSGQRYNPAKLTAAHPTLPHGTKVRVINLANNKEVIVTVNDRCRPHDKPFIDLSREAAKQLGFLGKGKTRVRIIPIEDDEEES